MKPLEKPTSAARRAVKVLCGFAALIAGGVLALPGIPGPGIPLILLGLWLLHDHFEWARRSFAWLRKRTAAFRPSARSPQTQAPETAREVPERR